MVGITQDDIVGSLRLAFIQHGLFAFYKYYGYKIPTDPNRVEIEFVNSSFTTETKSNELIREDIYLNIAVHAESLPRLYQQYTTVLDVLMSGDIPLRLRNSPNAYGDDDIDKSDGSFAISQILGVTNIMYGTEQENQYNTHRLYIDCCVEIQHVRLYGQNITTI